MSDPQGRVIAGRYRLTRKLGSGAMGAVWLADDELLHRTVAVKELLLPAGLSDEAAEQARQRALREGRIAARIRHNNAVTVYDVVDDAGKPVLIMEYLQSHSLADALARRGPLPPREVAHIGAEIASALAAAHDVGIVHRDVKPANILLGEDGSIKLTDFGISRATGDITVTSTGMLTGSPAYLSPEAARGAVPGPSSDVFSLGATLYRAVEGRLPFGQQDNTIAVLHAVANGQVDPPVQAGPLTDTLHWMLHSHPANRPEMHTAREWLAGVAAAPDEDPDAPTTTVEPATQIVRPAVGGPPQGRKKSRAPLFAGLGAAALVIAAAVVVALTVDFDGDNSAGSAGSGSQVTATTSGDSTATGVDTSASEGPDTGGPGTAEPSQEPVGAEDFEQVVREFYEVMPEDTDAGWALLTENLRDVGQDRFDTYWNTIGPITITEPPEADGYQVTVGIRVVYEDKGRIYFKRNVIGVVVLNGRPMIDSMKEIASERLDD